VDLQTIYPLASIEGQLIYGVHHQAQMHVYGRNGAQGAAQRLKSVQIPAGITNYNFAFGGFGAGDYTVSLEITSPTSPLFGIEYCYGGGLTPNNAQWMNSPLNGENPPFFTFTVPFVFPNRCQIHGDILTVTAGDTVEVQAYLASDTTSVIASY